MPLFSSGCASHFSRMSVKTSAGLSTWLAPTPEELGTHQVRSALLRISRSSRAAASWWKHVVPRPCCPQRCQASTLLIHVVRSCAAQDDRSLPVRWQGHHVVIVFAADFRPFHDTGDGLGFLRVSEQTYFGASGAVSPIANLHRDLRQQCLTQGDAPSSKLINLMIH